MCQQTKNWMVVWGTPLETTAQNQVLLHLSTSWQFFLQYVEILLTCTFVQQFYAFLFHRLHKIFLSKLFSIAVDVPFRIMCDQYVIRPIVDHTFSYELTIAHERSIEPTHGTKSMSKKIRLYCFTASNTLTYANSLSLLTKPNMHGKKRCEWHLFSLFYTTPMNPNLIRACPP